MLTCQLCGMTHPTMIAPSHLKKHGITGAEYKALFPGSVLRVQTEDSKAKMSQSKKGIESPFKGKVRGPNLALSARKKGVPQPHLRGLKRTDEQRARISAATKSGMVGVMTGVVRERLSAAITARKITGTYAAPMLGKTHSDEAREKISLAGKKRYAVESQKIIDAIIEKAAAEDLTVLQVTNQYWLDLKCVTCGTHFSTTRQAFTPSKKDGNELCPTCYPRMSGRSQAEEDLFKYIQSLHPTSIANDRSVLGGKELDIYVPELKLAFEYTGLYWHAEKQNPEKKHLLWKTQFAHKQGVRLITIFEDEWLNKRPIVESRVAGLLGKHAQSYMARKLQVSEVTSDAARDFLNCNHIQGCDTSSIRLGLYAGEELVQIATFKKTNMVKGGDGSAWELSRLCSSLGTRVQGGASKLIYSFRKMHPGTDLISYADRRWSDGDLYKSIGFEFAGESVPSYWYTDDYKTRQHRSAFMKHKLIECDEDRSLTEWELAQRKGMDRVWDCGTTKWVLRCK